MDLTSHKYEIRYMLKAYRRYYSFSIVIVIMIIIRSSSGSIATKYWKASPDEHVQFISREPGKAPKSVKPRV